MSTHKSRAIDPVAGVAWLAALAFTLGAWGGFALAITKAAPAIAAEPVSSVTIVNNVPTAERWTQPAGGCDDTLTRPRSAAAQECRDHGWTVRRIIVVGPGGYIRALDMEPCKYEDGPGPCFVNAQTQRWAGVSYWIGPRSERSHYVKGFNITGHGS